VEAWTNLGVLAKEVGQVEQALAAFRKAVDLRPGLPEVERNLRSALADSIPRWHLPMIADERRNGAYQAAIEAAVGPDDVVLDIGAGSGLLSLMAARAGAKKIYACEISSVLAEAAADVVAANGFADRIEIVNRKSSALRLGTEIREPATVIVSEIVDVGLLGEGILPSVRHAREHLAGANVRVIPSAAILYAALIQVPDLRMVSPVREIAGFDLSAFDRFRLPHQYRECHLDQVAHRLLSEPVAVKRSALDGTLSRSAAQTNEKFKIVVTNSGSIHGVAFWFDLLLDEHNTISTAISSGITAWGQALQLFEQDIEVEEGNVVELCCATDDTRIYFEVSDTGKLD
jgi:hypothetical protein